MSHPQEQVEAFDLKRVRRFGTRRFHRKNTKRGALLIEFANSGAKFGILKCVRVVPHKGRNHILCRCECGQEKPYTKHDLVSGKVVSCGCLQPARSRSNGLMNRRHGHSVNGKRTSTYVIWTDMIQRCENKNGSSYERYGGRGITVCSEWLSFDNFVRDMGERPNGLTLDRIDNNQGYCKQNCRWATMITQANNRTSNHIIEFMGQKKTATQWSRELGIPTPTILTRIRSGYEARDALSKAHLPRHRARNVIANS